MGERPPRVTLFLHEDILARTLAYERELCSWRTAEAEAGRGDPGRPPYEEVFGGTQVTPHRYHAAENLAAFIREGPHGHHIYYPQDCPGIDNGASHHHFPVIDTLLSIPFSLLHNLPRLVAMIPLTIYQQKLVTMGTEILMRWWWDPPSDSIEKSKKIHLHDSTRSAKPPPIHHHSRSGTTFLNTPFMVSSVEGTHESPSVP